MTRRLPSAAAPLAILFALALTLTVRPVVADEGMWTFDNFPKAAVKEKYGVEVSDEFLKHLRLATLRIPGCTGSFVSPDGLLLTNYHCAVGCAKDLSSGSKDYEAEGFLARSLGKEESCQAMEANQLVAITDVTEKIKGATKGLDGAEFIRAQRAAMSGIEKECSSDKVYRCDTVSLYHGGLYHLYKYRTYRDVRLVFVPEHDIAFFGGDPDNFNFPRYNLDMAILRVYDDGKPLKSDEHFTWSASGPKEGDAIFVPGNPGGTDRLLTVAQLEYMRDVQYPISLQRNAEMRGILEQFGKLGEEQTRISQDELLFLENGIKVQRGEFAALVDKRAFAEKVKAEKALRDRIAADPGKQAKYGAAWDEIAKAEETKAALRKPMSYEERGSGFASELYGVARTLVRGAAERPKPAGERLREFRDAAIPRIEQGLFSTAPYHRDLDQVSMEFSLSKLREELGTDDPFVKKVLGKQSPAEMAAATVGRSRLDDVDLRKKLWEGGAKAIEASDDPMIALARLVDADGRAIRKTYEDEVDAPERKNSELVAQAIFEDQGMKAYPDATFTPRVTFGTVKGWEEDRKVITPFTTFAGLFDRGTGRFPYVLPKSWLDARKALNPETPFNFSNDTDIVGGNSGSPAVNRNGEIVGLLFDGNLHSIGGNFWFDPKLNRAVAVDSRGLLEALRVVYGADRLVEEMRGK